MSSWKRIVFPSVAAAVLVIGMAYWGLPQVKASFTDQSQAGLVLVEASLAQPQDQKPFIGISLANNSAQLKSKLNLPSDTGVVILKVTKGSPGATAGLMNNDIITAVDNNSVSTAQGVTDAVRAKKVGDAISLTVLRSDGSHNIAVTLGAAPEKPDAPKGLPFGGFGGLEGLLGANPAQNLQSATITIKDKSGNTRTLSIVAGTIATVDANANTVSVMPNGGTTATTFTVTPSTKTGLAKVSDMKQGDRVIVVAENGNALAIHDLSGPAIKNPGRGASGNNIPRGLQMMPFHKFWPGLGGQQPSQ